MPFDSTPDGGGDCASSHRIQAVSGIPLCSYQSIEAMGLTCRMCECLMSVEHPVLARFSNYDHPPRVYLLFRTVEEAVAAAEVHRSECNAGYAKMVRFSEDGSGVLVLGIRLDAGAAETACSTGWFCVLEDPMAVMLGAK